MYNYVLCSSTYDCTMYTLSLVELLTSSSIACFGESDMALPQCHGTVETAPRCRRRAYWAKTQWTDSEFRKRNRGAMFFTLIMHIHLNLEYYRINYMIYHDSSFCHSVEKLCDYNKPLRLSKSCAKIDTHSTVTSCITKLQSVPHRYPRAA